MNFGEALEYAKQGYAICRGGWNGKGMFVFVRPGDELPVDMIVNKVKSLPQCVKDYYKSLYKGNYSKASCGEFTVSFTSYMCMKAVDGTIVNGWLASQTDMLANDWELF